MTDLLKDTDPQPDESRATDPAPAAGARPRTALKALAAVLAAVVAGVGIGEVILHTAYQDDTAATASGPAATASPSPSYGAKSNGNHFGSLRDLMLPVPEDYELGPDHGELGNDTVLDAKQVSARLNQALKTVPRKSRRRVESAWQSLHLRASAVRTYKADDNTFMVEMRLDQFNQQAVKATTAISGAFIDYSGAFRRGPAIAGHPGARCVLPPLEPSAEIDYMTCFAAVGDLMVTMEVTGVAPLNQGKEMAARLLKAQLDRLAIPGAVV